MVLRLVYRSTPVPIQGIGQPAGVISVLKPLLQFSLLHKVDIGLFLCSLDHSPFHG